MAFVIALSASAPSRADLAGLEHLTDISHAVFITHAPGDANRLFIVQQFGSISVLNLTTGLLEPQPFLNIPETHYPVESGLLGMAFHPDYQTNGKFYVYVTVPNGGTIIDGIASPLSSMIREYTVSSNPNVANTTYTPVLEMVRPHTTHLAGWIGFSPNDNHLYIASGDGGHGFDTGPGHTPGIGNAQDLTDNLMGKILRLDVNGDDFPDDPERNYAIPTDNPFVGLEGDDEIWAYGLRNPYRASFDRLTGDLWIGDVGQGAREEINLVPADSPGGVNFGWRLREGSLDTAFAGPRPPSLVDPVYQYDHSDSETGGQVVFGGYVYRGPDPDLQGKYFFGDSWTNKLWMLDPEDIPDSPDDPPLHATRVNAVLPTDDGGLAYPVSFGEDLEGNLYLANYYGRSIYRVRTAAFTPGDFNGDGVVDGNDIEPWEVGFASEGGATRASGDADLDGDVDGSDLLLWQRNLNAEPSPSGANSRTPVPEPPTALLALASLAAFFRRNHRRRR